MRARRQHTDTAQASGGRMGEGQRDAQCEGHCECQPQTAPSVHQVTPLACSDCRIGRIGVDPHANSAQDRASIGHMGAIQRPSRLISEHAGRTAVVACRQPGEAIIDHTKRMILRSGGSSLDWLELSADVLGSPGE